MYARDKGGYEWLRFVTPVLLTVVIGMGGYMGAWVAGRLQALDDRLRAVEITTALVKQRIEDIAK